MGCGIFDAIAIMNHRQYVHVSKTDSSVTQIAYHTWSVFEELLDLGTAFQDYNFFLYHGRPMKVLIYNDRFGEKSISWRTPYTWQQLPYKFYGRSNTPC